LVKSRFIGKRGLVEAAYFTDKLKRSSMDFRVRGGRLEIEKRSNIPTHAHKHGGGTASVKRSVKRDAACRFGGNCWIAIFDARLLLVSSISPCSCAAAL
jgi:hypothetical protein